ncbi:MAG: hypothetical protein C4291_09240 [Candidatus Dadabacteria bacterium]
MQTNLRLKPEVLRLIVYLLYLLILTMIPFRFSISPGRYFELWESFYTVSISDFIINVILFIPFGFLLFLLMKNTVWKDYTKILICSILGTSLSFIVEIYQLFLPRDSTLSDVVINTIGAFIGAVVAKFYYNKTVEIIRYIWNRIQMSKFLLILLIALYSLTILSLSVLPNQFFNLRNWNSNFISQFTDFRNWINFQNWDPNFTFQLGNLPTLDRPWFGKMYLVAIYNRALSDSEVYTNFIAGPYPIDSNRIKDGLIALYNFREGGGKDIHDSSGFGQPLNLAVYNPSRVRWLTPNGLEILGNTIIQRKDPVEKLYSTIKNTNTLTIEVWVEPDKFSQAVLGRIVSFSAGSTPPLSNFTLAQRGKNLYFLLRTPLTGLNGTNRALITKDNFLTKEIQHLVITYENGIERLFVNGLQHSQIAIFDDNLIDLFGKNILGKIAFCFSFFIPLGFLFYALLLNNPWGFITISMLSSFFSFGLLVIMEVLNFVIFPQDFDFTLLYSGVLVGIFNIFFCTICDKSGLFRETNS